MIDLNLLVIILTGHFIADFVMQWDYIALAKSSSYLVLTLHVLIYTATMLAIMLVAGLIVVGSGINPLLVIQWLGFNGLMHWLTDWASSRVCKRLWLAERRHDFFVVIGLDQLIHYATLFVSLMWFLGA